MEVARGLLRRPDGRLDPAAITHLALLVIGFGLLLWIGRGQWFDADEWAFLTERRDPSTLLLAHVGHWSTIPHLIYQGLYRLVGLRDYTPWLVLILAVHTGIVHVGWRLALRAGADRWIATAAAAVLLVLGAGAENIWWGFQIGLAGSVLAGLVALALLERGQRIGESRRSEVQVTVLLTPALMLSGVTLAAIAGVAVMLLLTRGWRAAVRTCAVPTVVYLLWASTIWLPSLPADRDPGSVSVAALGFAGRVVIHALAATVRAPRSVGIVLAVGLLVVVARSVADPSARRHHAPIVAAAAAAVAFTVITGISRAGLGPAAAEASRYVHVVAALLVPLLAVALTGVVVLAGRTGQAARTGVVVVLVVLAGAQLAELHEAAVVQAADERRTERELAAAAQVLASGAPVSDTPILVGRATGVDTDVLGAFVAEDALRDDVDPDPSDLVSARAALHIRPDAPVRPGGTPAVVTRAAGTTPAVDGCVKVGGAGRAILSVPAPTRLVLEAAAAVQLELDVSQHGVSAHRPRRLEVGTAPSGVAVDLAGATIEVRVPPGPAVRICGVQDGTAGAP